MDLGGQATPAAPERVILRFFRSPFSPAQEEALVARTAVESIIQVSRSIAVAIVRVKAVRPFILADMQAACASCFEDGWLAWELSDIRPVTHCDNPCGTGYLRRRFPPTRQSLIIEQDVLGRRLQSSVISSMSSFSGDCCGSVLKYRFVTILVRELAEGKLRFSKVECVWLP